MEGHSVKIGALLDLDSKMIFVPNYFADTSENLHPSKSRLGGESSIFQHIVARLIKINRFCLHHLLSHNLDTHMYSANNSYMYLKF